MSDAELLIRAFVAILLGSCGLDLLVFYGGEGEKDSETIAGWLAGSASLAIAVWAAVGWML